MKELLRLTILFIFSLSAVIGQAQSGIYESYVILDNGGGNTYYDLQAATGNPDFNGANLGSFQCTEVLLLNGAQNNIYKCNTNNITNGFLNYRIYETTATPPGFNGVSLPFLSNDGPAGICAPSSGINQTWEEASATINVISGLNVGTHYRCR